MTPQPLTPPDLLEQARLALLRGDLGQARSLLDRLTAAEPDNAPAQDLLATVAAKQAAVQDSASALPDSFSARQWPKPLLLIVYLILGVLAVLLPGRNRHNSSHHPNSWGENITIGLVLGVVFFVWTIAKKH